MPTTTMTPEEVLKYGKRVILFQKGKGRKKREFVIEDNRIFQQAILYDDGIKCITKTNPVEIDDIYNDIERVYSRKSKGVLIARRSGNYTSNQKKLLPLKKTGKGMGHSVVQSEIARKAFLMLETVDHYEHLKRQAKNKLGTKRAAIF